MGINDLASADLRDRTGKQSIRVRSGESSPCFSGQRSSLMDERAFRSFLALERRRAERSRRPFLLILLDVGKLLSDSSAEKTLRQIILILSSCTRDTDLIGWYNTQAILGVIFTEIGTATESEDVPELLLLKLKNALNDKLTVDQRKQVIVSSYSFPRKLEGDHSVLLADTTLYPDLEQNHKRNRVKLAIKRAIDIMGSGLFLIVFSPIYALVALAVKFSSKGPVLYKQERIGQFGTRFQFLKFRSMYINNDPKIHREYAQRCISGKDDCAIKNDKGKTVYKLTNDPRVTPIGRWIRKTSLDEFPQFWNVLRGDMSLVGPRPPLPYEIELYDHWHQRRVREVRPGITGLWQVTGRNRTTFEEMVRLDLQYCRSWSIWLDIKILLRTPYSVLFGNDAY